MVTIEILRRRRDGTNVRWETFAFEPRAEAETVADALTALNAREPLIDVHGRETEPIVWERSCLQKKCGACAMVINGTPDLACRRKIGKRERHLRLEPLRKFPVVADLQTDRSVMMHRLRQLEVWLRETPRMNERIAGVGYEASRCLQCGCCLEVCPNYDPEGRFAGMAGAVPASRILAELSPDSESRLPQNYRESIFEGCGKSLACRKVCPAEIDADRMLVNSNAVALWKRYLR